MSVFSKRNLLIGIVTLIIIGIGSGAAIWATHKFLRRSTSVNSQVTAYLLDDRGAVNGLLLASGDQLHFSPRPVVAPVLHQLTVASFTSNKFRPADTRSSRPTPDLHARMVPGVRMTNVVQGIATIGEGLLID